MRDPSQKLRNRAVDVLLEEDGRILEKIMREAGDVLAEEITGKNENGNPQKSISWWGEHHSGLPSHLSFLEGKIREGEQPVFCNISYHSATSYQTLYVPVPYAVARSYQGLKETVWLNAPDECPVSAGYDWEETARKFSHACANISYSVRFGDRPTIGWLAEAHKKREPLYLPNVQEAPVAGVREEKVFSAAKDSEAALGMASVLYLPLIGSEYLKPIKRNPGHGEDDMYAAAVLMLWSPIVDRWDHLNLDRSKFYEGEPVHSTRTIPRENVDNRLHWIEDIINRDNANQIWRESDYQSLIHSLIRYSQDGSSSEKEVVEDFSHGLTNLIEPVVGKGGEDRFTLKEWLEYFLHKAGGFFHEINNRKFLDTSNTVVSIEKIGEILLDEKKPDQISTDGLGIPDDTYISIESRETVESITKEPAKDLGEHAKEVGVVKIFISANNVTVRIHELPKHEKKFSLIGSEEALRRYFASRRGIPVPRVSGSAAETKGGLGLALYSVVTSRLGVFRRFYISPDGEEKCYIVFSLPHDGV